MQRIHAEVVTDGHVEIRMIDSDRAQRLRIKCRVELLRTLWMGVAWNLKDKAAARSALCGEGLFLALIVRGAWGSARAHAIKELPTRGELVEKNFDRLPRSG